MKRSENTQYTIRRCTGSDCTGYVPDDWPHARASIVLKKNSADELWYQVHVAETKADALTWVEQDRRVLADSGLIDELRRDGWL